MILLFQEEEIGNFNSMTITDPQHLLRTPNSTLNLFSRKIKLELIKLEQATPTVFGEEVQLINALVINFMDVKEHLMEIITSIQ